MTGVRVWFVNRFFHPDYSATSQKLSDLAFHLARRGRQIGVIASRGVYDDPQAVLPALDDCRGVAIHRVARTRFGRDKLLGRASDYLRMYGAFAAAAARLRESGDWIVVKTDPPLLSAACAIDCSNAQGRPNGSGSFPTGATTRRFDHCRARTTDCARLGVSAIDSSSDIPAISAALTNMRRSWRRPNG